MSQQLRQRQILTPEKQRVLEQLLDIAGQQQYAKITLVIEHGVLRKVEGPAPTILLPK